ncbi:MAG: hypothetical protein ACTSR3_11215 [Candidatus Helarchaeota archaeon]
MANIIFRSRISSAYRYNWFLVFFSPLCLIPIIVVLRSPDLDILIKIFVVGIVLIPFTLLVWLSLHFMVSYLIIYENGIKFRKPYRFLRSTFVPMELIEDVKLSTGGIMRASFFGNLKTANRIDIYIRTRLKPLDITEHWVENINSAYKIIKDNIKNYKS